MATSHAGRTGRLSPGAALKLSAAQSKRSNAGAAYELQTAHWIQILVNQKKLSVMVKVPTSMAIVGVGAGGLLSCRPCSPATTDYLGCLPDGRMFALEVKHWAPGSPRQSFPISRLPSQQQNMLNSVAESGGVAGVLIFTPKQAYCVPWRALISGLRSTSTWSPFAVRGVDFVTAAEAPWTDQAQREAKE